MQHRIGQQKANPEITQFKREGGDLKNLHGQQQVLFCQNLAIIEDLCQSSDSLLDQLSNLRTYYREVEKDISDFIDLQDRSKGRLTNLPKIEESHKDIVFQECMIRLKHVDMVIYSVRDISNNIIESISDNLMQANLILYFSKDSFLGVKFLTRTWQESLKNKVEGIKALSRINLEFHWHFLIRPQSQWLMLRCLADTTMHLLLALNNTLFIALMCIDPHHPLELKLMIDICEI